ncbi:hypothetical protein FQZ97_931790 [compost metagenome]
MQAVAAILGRGVQAATGQQLAQAVVDAELAMQALGRAAGGQLGAEGQQHAGFAAELVERGFQRPGRDVEDLALALRADFQRGGEALGGQGRGQAKAQQQGAGEGRAGEGAKALRVLHGGVSQVKREGLCLPCHARSEKRLSFRKKNYRRLVDR